MINRREFLAASTTVASSAQTRRRPNILHIQTDQQQWATIAGRSESRTPNPGCSDWSSDILCAYYGGEFLYTQRIALNRRYKYVFNGFEFD